MKNKYVGLLMIGVGVILGIIIFIFNNALRDIVSATCTHGPTCSMYGTINTQTYISMALVAIIIVIGIILFFSKEEKNIEKHFVTKTKYEKSKTPEEHKRKINISELNADEKKIVNLIVENQGTIFQSELVEKTGFTKVKVTRILDGLEGRQVIQRMRRGMTNVVILK